MAILPEHLDEVLVECDPQTLKLTKNKFGNIAIYCIVMLLSFEALIDNQEAEAISQGEDSRVKWQEQYSDGVLVS